MRGLNIIVAGPDGARFYAALETAMAAAALGKTVRLFLQGEAAALLREPVGYDGDAARWAAGQPGLAELVAEAAAAEIALFVCQSGMALVGLSAGELAPHARPSGLVSFLVGAEADDRLIVY